MASTTSPPGQSWYRRLAEGIKTHPFGSVLAVLAFGLGAVLLVTAYFLGQPAFVGYNPFAAYLATNIGGLLIFVTAYSLLSEVLLKREFMQRLSEKLDEKLLQGSLAKTIRATGLEEIHLPFREDSLLNKIGQSRRVRMVVMRSNTFFKENHDKLREMIVSRDLTMEVVLPDPDNVTLMEFLAPRFSDVPSASSLAETIRTVKKVWLKQSIHDTLPPELKSNLKVVLHDHYPIYSAYVFDNSELWFVPYHYRKDYHDIPVFIFRGDISGSEIAKDVEDLVGHGKPQTLE